MKFQWIAFNWEKVEKLTSVAKTRWPSKPANGSLGSFQRQGWGITYNAMKFIQQFL